MSRETWRLIRSSKRFYVKTYRAGAKALLVSGLLNVFFSVSIYYAYFSQPEHDFYSTSGVTEPVKLTPLDEPNYSSVPLLKSTQKATETEQKPLPK